MAISSHLSIQVGDVAANLTRCCSAEAGRINNRRPQSLARARVRHAVVMATAARAEVNLRTHGYAVALTFFRALKTFRLTFLRMRDICNIINVQRKDKGFMVKILRVVR